MATEHSFELDHKLYAELLNYCLVTPEKRPNSWNPMNIQESNISIFQNHVYFSWDTNVRELSCMEILQVGKFLFKVFNT